ncbi:MAG: GNAT family N-acetyltransferase [Gammaproteobacteria bacterium]
MAKSKLRVQWVEHENDFENLANAWDDLALAIKAPLFLRHAWFKAAWAWAKQHAKLKILTLYDEMNLVAICPMILQPTRYYHMQVEELALLTIPDTQCCDWLIAKTHVAAAYDAIMKALSRCHFHWDVINWRLLAPDAQLLSHQVPSSLFRLKAIENEIHYSVHLIPDWEGYYKNKSRRLKKGNNAILNKLTKAGTLELCRIAPDQHQQVAILDIITKLSSTSWKNEVETALNFEGPRAFVSKLFELFSNQHDIVVWLLKLNGQPIAYELQLTEQGRYYALRSDYDPSFQALSPGTYLNWKIIQALFQERAVHYYMGPGRNEYKLRWENQSLILATLRGYNDTFKGKLMQWLERNIYPTLRPVKHQIIKLTRG